MICFILHTNFQSSVRMSEYAKDDELSSSMEKTFHIQYKDNYFYRPNPIDGLVESFLPDQTISLTWQIWVNDSVSFFLFYSSFSLGCIEF